MLVESRAPPPGLDGRDARPSTVLLNSGWKSIYIKFTSLGVVTSRRLATLRQVMLQQEKELFDPGTQLALLRLQTVEMFMLGMMCAMTIIAITPSSPRIS